MIQMLGEVFLFIKKELRVRENLFKREIESKATTPETFLL